MTRRRGEKRNARGAIGQKLKKMNEGGSKASIK